MGKIFDFCKENSRALQSVLLWPLFDMKKKFTVDDAGNSSVYFGFICVPVVIKEKCRTHMNPRYRYMVIFCIKHLNQEYNSVYMYNVHNTCNIFNSVLCVFQGYNGNHYNILCLSNTSDLFCVTSFVVSRIKNNACSQVPTIYMVWFTMQQFKMLSPCIKPNHWHFWICVVGLLRIQPKFRSFVAISWHSISTQTRLYECFEYC
jgi:hypothetical protein